MEVEGDADRVRGLLPLQAQQRRQKAEDGVGIEPVPGRQRPDAVVGPVDDAVSVDDHELHRGNLLSKRKNYSLDDYTTSKPDSQQRKLLFFVSGLSLFVFLL